jgi:hypothetical protein
MTLITRIILWIARISGSLVAAFVLIFVLASVFKENGDSFNSTGEMISFIFFFPMGLIIGLGLALKWEGLGGLVATVAMIGTFVVRPDLIYETTLIGFSVPGLLYLTYWLLARRRPSPVHQAIKTHDPNQDEP